MAWRLQDGGNRHIFRSNSGSPSPCQNQNPRPAATYQIWEVAEPTSAAPTYFSAVNIDGESVINAGVGTNIPTRKALGEIDGFRKDSSAKPLVVSIGSGLNPRIAVPRTPSFAPSSIITTIKALQSIVNNTEEVHEHMKRISEAQGFDYFRFSVDSGLEDLLLERKIS